jgi:hypothetical protein
LGKFGKLSRIAGVSETGARSEILSESEGSQSSTLPDSSITDLPSYQFINFKD